MGSATFALPSLDALFQCGYVITGVITQPDKPAGRGRVLHAPPIKKRACELHLPTFQPKSLKADETRELVGALAPDLIVVVAYGKILPPWLLQFPRYGCINLHGSLLPKYRGAAPVHWAVAGGETETGVCTMLLDEGLDTGPVFLCERTMIGPEEGTPEVYDRLAKLGAPLVVKTIEGVLAGTLKPEAQDNSRATVAPILKKENGFLNWTHSAQEIHNRIRGFNPWPGTVTKFRGQTCKILKTTVAAVYERPEGPRSESAVAGSLKYRPPLQSDPGSLIALKGSLMVMCGNGIPLEILSIQPENRKAVSGANFANGMRIQAGEKFQAVLDNDENG
jgi:methionyl-tRNA formyltransferase